MASPSLNVWTSRCANSALQQVHDDGYVLARLTRGRARFFRLPHVRIRELEPSAEEFACHALRRATPNPTCRSPPGST
jgi:hypothetical protein